MVQRLLSRDIAPLSSGALIVHRTVKKRDGRPCPCTLSLIQVVVGEVLAW